MRMYLSLGLLAATLSAQSSTYRIVVVEGEDAVNIIQQKTAVAPVVEVRDRNDLPVAGVPVTFTISSNTAAFAGGTQTLTVATNAAGRAIASSLSPLTSGAVQINVTAAVQGQTLAATITQTNVMTAAQAAATATGAGSAAGGGTTGTSTTAGGGSGGGLSGKTLGLVVGAAGAAAAAGALALAESEPENAAPTISGVTASSSTALQGATQITFSVSATDPENDALTYQWNFGDGATSTLPSPSHVYQSAGAFRASVTVSDGRGSVSGETSVTVGSVTGRWAGVWTCVGGSCGSGVDVTVVIDAVQNGETITGTSTHRYGPTGTPETCSMPSGQARSPRRVDFGPRPGCGLQGANWQGDINDAFTRIDFTFTNGPFYLIRQ